MNIINHKSIKMKKLLLSAFIISVLVSCQAPKENQPSSPTVIGYEFNEKGEKQNIVAGDVAITDIYMDYIQAHNDKDLNKIYEMDTEDVVIKAANGDVFNGNKLHGEQLEAWFKVSNPIWTVKWMVTNTVQSTEGNSQNWLTTGVDLVQEIEGESITTHHILDVQFAKGKIKELNVYNRASEKK